MHKMKYLNRTVLGQKYRQTRNRLRIKTVHK